MTGTFVSYKRWSVALFLILTAVLGVLGMIVPAYAACTNPATIPAGFAAPCPVWSVSAASVPQSGSLTLSATPQAGTDYILTTAYISQGTAWNPYTLSGNNAVPNYSSAQATLTLSSAQLQALSLGTHYAVSWDWLWDATAQCYKGPGLNQCNTGQWRVQSFTITSTYAYSQSAYYAYSQSSYYTYSQAAYTSAPVVSVSPTTLSFPSQQVGTTSAVQYATLTNTGNATLTFTSDSITGDFAFGGLGSCGATLSVGARCTYSAKFNPTAVGTRTSVITINDNTSNTPQIINLTGTGVSTYAYSQSAYYAYSQSSYYAYSQSAYTTGVDNYYITTTGSDSNACTQASPCKTLNSVNSRLGSSLLLGSGGTTVHVAPGTYPSVSLTKAGTASARITYISDTKWGARVPPVVFFNDGASYITFQNFEIDGTLSANACCGVDAWAASGIWIIGNKIHDTASGCNSDSTAVILFNATVLGDPATPNVGNNIADGNFLYHNNCGASGSTPNLSGQHGIYSVLSGDIIRNNIVVDQGGGWCIHSWHKVSNWTVVNNILANCGNGGIEIGNDSSTGVSNNNTTINNNIVVNSGNSTFATGGIDFRGNCGSNIAANSNLMYGNTGGNYVGLGSCSGGGPTPTGTQTGTDSTTFVNDTGTGVGNYHSLVGSTAIDRGTTTCAAGITNCAPTADFDGITRPQGTACDIGAYEYH